MKCLGVFMLLHLRFYKRPVGRPYTYYLMLMYLGSYCFFGSNIPGVFLKWDTYSDSVQTLLESEKLKKRGLKNTNEFLNYTSLPDHKTVYWMADMQFSKLY